MTELAVAEKPITQETSSVISDSFVPDTVDSFVPDEPTQGQSGLANLLNVGMDIIKDIPAQIQDLMTIPSKLLGLPSPDFKSKLSTESVPYLMEKANTPIGTIPIPTLSYNDFNNIIHGKFTYTVGDVSPTPIDIGYYGLLGGVLARNQLATARWNHQLNKLIKTEEVRGAVMNNIESFDNLMTQVGIKLPTGMSLESKTEFVLNQAKTSPKLGTAIMDLVKGKIVSAPVPTTQPVTPTTGQAVAPQVGELPKPVPVSPQVPIVAPIEPQGGTIAPKVDISTPTGEGKVSEGKISKVAQDIQSKALENKLTEDLGGLAQYTPTTIKEQVAKVTDLITNEPDRFRSVIRGEEPLPNGILGGTIIKAAEDKAMLEGDVELIRDIANSPLTSETSIHAQEMRMLAERNPDSPVTAIKEITKARETMAQKRLKTKETKKLHKTEVGKIKEEIKKLTPTKEDWASFVKSIQC